MASRLLEPQVPKEQLLTEIEELIRVAPQMETLREPTTETLSWVGRVSAVIDRWDSSQSIPLSLHLNQIRQAGQRFDITGSYHGIMTQLHYARNDIRLSTVGPINLAVGQGMVYDYYDEVRKIVEGARQDLLFVDPYLDAEFISRYLNHVSQGVTIRLLTEKRMSTLMPAVELFSKQSQLKIEVRSDAGFHDRYLFVDKKLGYHSGASFKDAVKKAPTTLTQITDTLSVVLQTYETLWSNGKVHR